MINKLASIYFKVEAKINKLSDLFSDGLLYILIATFVLSIIISF